MNNDMENMTLQKELPGLRGFSVSNIKNMRQFYEQWSILTNRQPMAVDLQSADDKSVIFNEAKED